MVPAIVSEMSLREIAIQRPKLIAREDWLRHGAVYDMDRTLAPGWHALLVKATGESTVRRRVHYTLDGIDSICGCAHGMVSLSEWPHEPLPDLLDVAKAGIVCTSCMRMAAKIGTWGGEKTC